jgi:hypothetical protein
VIAVLSAVGYLTLLAWLGARRQFLLCLMAACLVGFTMRLVSVVYLDVAGPEYSLQLFRDIGGAGAAAPLLLAYLIYVSAFLVVFRATTMRALAATADRLVASGPTSTDRLIANGVFCVYVAFIALLFLDLLRIGVIPLFAGLERFEYTEQYGGFWHRLLMNYGMLLALPLGAFYSLGVFFGKRGDSRFVGLLIVLFAYLFLAGHRFSAFYSHSAAFVMPYAAVLGWQQFSERLADEERRRQQLIARRVLIGALAVLLVLVGVALYRSYFFTRANNERSPFESLRQRVFVQQGEMWYATWDRVVARRFDPAGAIDRLFVHPIVADRNSTMPFLMLKEIDEKAYTPLDVGSVYTGGFPEVFFELFPPAGAYAVVFMVALVTAQLMKALLLAVLERRYLRLALCWYVLFALVLISLSGMLNFIVNWKFWLKVSALVTWVAIEMDRDSFRRMAAGRPAVSVTRVGHPEPLR